MENTIPPQDNESKLIYSDMAIPGSCAITPVNSTTVRVRVRVSYFNPYNTPEDAKRLQIYFHDENQSSFSEGYILTVL